MKNDWDFRVGNVVCEVRAGGIVIHEGKVLLDHVLSADEYLLPGGAVKIGEMSNEALSREFLEEFSVKVRVGKLIFVSEFFGHWQDLKTHIVQFEYEVTGGNLQLDFDKMEADVEKVWLPVSELGQFSIVPEDLKFRLENYL